MEAEQQKRLSEEGRKVQEFNVQLKSSLNQLSLSSSSSFNLFKFNRIMQFKHAHMTHIKQKKI